MTKANMSMRNNLLSILTKKLIHVLHGKLLNDVYILSTSYAIKRNYILLW